MRYIRKAFSVNDFSLSPGQHVVLLITPGQSPIARTVYELFRAAERPFTSNIEARLIDAEEPVDIIAAEERAVRRAGEDVVMISSSLEENLLELLTALMKGYDPSLSLPLRRAGRITLFRPFSLVPLMDLYAYAAARGEVEATRPKYLYEELLEVTVTGPELAYSYKRVLRLLGNVRARGESVYQGRAG